MAKRSLIAWLTGEVYVTPVHKLTHDSRCGRGMYSPDIVGSYIFKIAGDRWQSVKEVGLAENAESITYYDPDGG